SPSSAEADSQRLVNPYQRTTNCGQRTTDKRSGDSSPPVAGEDEGRPVERRDPVSFVSLWVRPHQPASQIELRMFPSFLEQPELGLPQRLQLRHLLLPQVAVEPGHQSLRGRV